MRIVGFVLIGVFLMVGIGSNLAAMIDPPSLIIVLGFTTGVLLISGSQLGAMLRGISPGSLNAEEAAAAADGWRSARFGSLAAGAVGTMIGWIIMLKNLDDPAAIGPGMAISLLTLMYGLLIAFALSLPLQAHIEKQADIPRDSSVSATAVFAILISIFCGVATFGALFLSISKSS